MFQTMLRNPLASPDVIGFSAGASCGALTALVLTGGFVLPGAILGGLAMAIAATLLTWNGNLHPYRLILIGIGASLVLSVVADLLISRLDAKVAADMAKWPIGNLNARDWSDVRLVWTGPIARRMVKVGRPALLAAAVVGAIVVLLADTLARLVPVVQLPAGACTAVIGAPVLMWLLVVQFRKATL